MTRKLIGVLAITVFISFLLVSCKSKQKRVLVHPTTTPVIVEKSPENVTSPAVASATLEREPAVSAPVEEFRSITVQLPAVQREFRAAWVATVANINWPSKRNLSTEEQKREAISLLDFLQANNFNAVIFQVRPSADALYNSSHEPWSYFLNGEIGKKPYPYYDPLEFWVEEAHNRGLELHVWLNPYRAHHSSGGEVTSQSMVRKAPGMVVRLKNGMYWFDPANKNTQDHASRVVMDIVKRYDIDGVHFDDYFYPYASYNGGGDFPDNQTWNEYKRNGGNLSRADWRRQQVNQFIERIYNEIKAEKKYVKFGLSPFGIWKPGYPAGVTGSSQYDELYADAKLWLNKGWIDYFAPQLYWPIEPQRQSFTALLKWWQSENTHNRHLWPGLNTVEVRSPDRPREIVNQVMATREIVPDSKGVIHWSIAGLTRNPQTTRALKEGPYQEKALVPASPWLQSFPIAIPTLLLTKEDKGVFAKWQSKTPDEVKHWIVYARYGNDWEQVVYDPHITSFEFPFNKSGKKLNAVAVKALDRLSNESDYVALEVR